MRFGTMVAAATCALGVLVFPVTVSALTFSDISVPVGNSVEDVAVADFDQDGNLDVATANSGSQDVSVLYGDANGRFASRRDFFAGTLPASLAVADFNMDGGPDVALGSYRDTNARISVLIGHSGGGLGAAYTYDAGGMPTSVAAGDFDQDGDPDLAVANYQADTVSVLLGHGGAFAPRQDVAEIDGPEAVVVGDFNQDGDPDLAVSSVGSRQVEVLLGEAGAGFGSQQGLPAGNRPDDMAVGDFNQDGDPDLAVTNFESDTVSVLLGEEGGQLGSRQDYGVGDAPEDVAIGDFNGDGDPDLAVPNYLWDTVSVLPGGEGGTFDRKQDFRTHDFPYAAATGDFNKDRDVDLVVANLESDDVSVLLNTSKPIVNASPSNLSLPATPLGSMSSRRDITVKNEGEGGLSVSAVKITGEDADQFAVSGETCTDDRVRPGRTCTIGVRLKPTVEGPLSATLRISDNAADTPQHVVLSGHGGQAPAPAFSASPSSLGFGNQGINTTSAARKVTVTNTGNDDLTISATAIGGANPRHFAIASDACKGKSIAPNATCDVAVTFRPTTTGALAGLLAFTHDAAGSPHAIALTGRGCRVIVGSVCLGQPLAPDKNG